MFGSLEKKGKYVKKRAGAAGRGVQAEEDIIDEPDKKLCPQCKALLVLRQFQSGPKTALELAGLGVCTHFNYSWSRERTHNQIGCKSVNICKEDAEGKSAIREI